MSSQPSGSRTKASTLNVIAESVRLLSLKVKLRGNQTNDYNSKNFKEDRQLVDDLRVLLAQRVKTATEAVVGLGEDDTQALVNFLDEAIKDHLSDFKERSRALALLLGIVTSTPVFPARFLVTPLEYNPNRYATGGFGTVHRGIDPNVCVKTMPRASSKAYVPWIMEVILWAHSSHPNVLPFEGLFFEGDGVSSQVCLVSPFMENGNLSEYAPRLPQRSRLPLLLDAASGLQYIHELGIVHNNLKGQSVLITKEGRAVLASFGISRVNTTTAATTTAPSFTLRFAAPEVVVGGEKVSDKSDVWSFGCLCYEVLSRRIPYYQYSPAQLFSIFLRKEPPQRPGIAKRPVKSSDDDSEADSDEEDENDFDPIDDEVWNLIARCCEPDPDDRLMVLQIKEILSILAPSTVSQVPDVISASVRRLVSGIEARSDQVGRPYVEKNQQTMHLRGLLAQRIKPVIKAVAELSKDDAQTFVNFLDQFVLFGVLEYDVPDPKKRARALALLSKIIARTRVYPQRLIIERVEYRPRPKAVGGSGAVYQGMDPNVCVKVMVRVDDKAFGSWIRELIVWAHSSHPNLLPFTGIFFEDNDGVSQVCLVSPFMKNGNLSEYAPGLSQESRFPLLLDVANGLQFVHGFNIIHSDLKGQNVLITDQFKAVIADFGSSRVTTTTTATATISSWTLGYAAPELVVGGEKPTKMSDVWSFGCLCYETLSKKRPYYQYTIHQFIAALIRKEPPQRPGSLRTLNQARDQHDSGDDDDDSDESSDSDENPDSEEQKLEMIDNSAWGLIMGCCTPVAEERLTVLQIQELLEEILKRRS